MAQERLYGFLMEMGHTFEGNMHVALVLIALLIILVGVLYTILLFLWQWLVRAPEWKVFIYFNLLALSAFSWYRFKIGTTALAYTSTIITFILLVGVIIYLMYWLVRKDHPQPGEKVNEYPLAPV